MAAGIAWLLNLDADVELARVARGSRYAPTDAVREAMAPWARALAARLLAAGDVLVDENSAPSSAAGRLGRAFCPTPRAVEILTRSGAQPEPHPPVDVLARVNSRAFSAALGQTLPGAVFVDDLDGALTVLARPPPVGRAWRAKRAFGMAGRGQRTLEAGEVARDDADRAFLRAAFAEAGLQLEPHVAIARELALHGLLAASGSSELGSAMIQECDARGQWVASREAAPGEISTSLMAALREEAAKVAAALHEAGYFGPFGLDAFEYRQGDGVVLQPRSEINARYSMAFPKELAQRGGEATSSSILPSARSIES